MQNRWYNQIDWPMLGGLLFLSGMGVATIWSAGTGAGAQGHYAVRQAWWLLLGLAAWVAGFTLDRRFLQRGAYTIYGFVFLVLLLMPLIGRGAGAHRWISFGAVSLQPSEFAKIALILALARYFQDLKVLPPYGLPQLAVPALLTTAFVVPVALQPDLGTALFLVMIAVPLVFLMGVRMWTLVSLALIAAAAAPAFFFSLRPYQRGRLLAFLDPGRDPLGTGYHVVQSKIAIGSGGFLGKGYLEGTQSQLRFIPEQHTDFIFSVLAEEWGFIGVFLLLIAFLFLFFWAVSYYKHLQTRFAVLTVMGIAIAFALQAGINLGMTSGILPVVGLPLPLVSYGGSSLVTTFFGFGLIAGFHHRRV